MAMKRARGYTLTETMLTLAIVGMISTVAAPLFVQMTNFWRQTIARNSIQRDVRSSLDTIDRFTRQAESGRVAIDRLTGQPPCSRLSFFDIQGRSVSFYQQGSKLFMRVGSNVTMLSSNIAYIAFSYPRTDDVSIISVAITTQSPTYLGGTKALQLSIQQVRIMN